MSVRRWRGAARARWTLARQLLALQVALVLVAVAVAVTLSVWQVRRDVTEQAERRCLSIAQTIAGIGWVQQQLSGASPTSTLQPMTGRILQDTGVDFVTIMSPAGTRYTHPDSSQIGRHYLGTIAPALAGGTVVETYTGTLGPSVRAVVPVRATPSAPIVGLVAVGVEVGALAPEIASRIWVIVALGGGVLVLALLGSYLIGRRMRRLTHGLGPDELGLMHGYYDAVLHSVREGLVLLDNSGRVELMNDEAVRLLAIEGSAVGRPIGELGLPSDLAEAMVGPRSLVDAVHLAKDRALVISALPALDRTAGRSRRSSLGRAITMRDHTEMTELTNELGSSRDLTEALRSQAHESANRMHAVITLVELGRYQDAIAFATEELRTAQHLTDQVFGAISDPVIAALLLGKSQVAAERGIEFLVTPDSALDADALPDAELSARELLTVLGNLVDNAIDAVAGADVRRVTVTVRRTDPDVDALLIEVADTGPGLDEDAALLAFRRGWSTKKNDTLHGHGLGLGLVGQIVQRHGGDISVRRSGGAVFRVEIGAGLRATRASIVSGNR